MQQGRHMLLLPCIKHMNTNNKQGLGIVEILIAIFLTSVGIMALLSFQPEGWRTQSHADYRGRAAGILQKTLLEYEERIMNPCSTAPAGQTTTVNSSGQTAAIAGDVTYTVVTTVVQTNTSPESYLITVTVSWTNIGAGKASHIEESMTVSRQEFYRFPLGCTNA